jgi:hypothetical protein
MGRTCSAKRYRTETHTKFWTEYLKAREHADELGVDGR